MAHWVGYLKQENIAVTGTTKQEAIAKLAAKATRFPKGTIQRQLQAIREPVAVMYGDDGLDVLAKVFPCNCGSVKRHTEVREIENA
jgi:hypothetical protein